MPTRRSFDLVIFGGTGDLAMRKLLPAMFRRFLDEQIPEDSRIIGVAREEQAEADYRDRVREALSSHGERGATKVDAFLELVRLSPAGRHQR